jgi:FkbM family methyltransferase
VTFQDLKQAFADGSIGKPAYIEAMHELHRRLFEYPAIIAGADVASIEVTADGVVLTTKASGIRLGVTELDERLIPIEILNFGSYETTETAMFVRLARDVDVVFDIGANIGWYSLNLTNHYAGAVEIHAFEPLPPTFAQLVANLRLNAADSVVANNFGLSREAGEIAFYYYPEGSGNASAANLSERSDVEEVVCRVSTLDEYCLKSAVKPGLIKCDVEGAEFLVFQGGRETIASATPIVFTEMLRKWAKQFGYSPNDILDWFAELGYSCYTVAGDRLRLFGRMDDQTAETNFFFLHDTAHASQIADLCDAV